MILNKGVFPTMITPYTNDNKIDFEGVEKIVDWYIKNDCEGIFAVCQSSEMAFLSLTERIELCKATVNAAKKAPYKMNVVTGGHCSVDLDEQVREITEMSKCGADAVVLVTNCFDMHNDGDETWIKNAEYVLSKVPQDIYFGIYECPRPYKRLLTPKIIDWLIKTKRFRFIKDTCCDPQMLTDRLKQLEGTGISLYNANAQTLLHTLKGGGAGYSGIMANFHPSLYVWLCSNFEKQPEKAENLQAILSMYAFEEVMHYPITAKYHMQLEGVDINLFARSANEKDLSLYEKFCVEQGFEFEKKLAKYISEE